MNASSNTIRFENSAPMRKLTLYDFSGIRIGPSIPLDTNYSYNSCASGGTVSSWAGRASEGYQPGQNVTLTAIFSYLGSDYEAKKSITIPGTTPTPTPTPTPTLMPKPVSNLLPGLRPTMSNLRSVAGGCAFYIDNYNPEFNWYAKGVIEIDKDGNAFIPVLNGQSQQHYLSTSRDGYETINAIETLFECVPLTPEPSPTTVPCNAECEAERKAIAEAEKQASDPKTYFPVWVKDDQTYYTNFVLSTVKDKYGNVAFKFLNQIPAVPSEIQYNPSTAGFGVYKMMLKQWVDTEILNLPKNPSVSSQSNTDQTQTTSSSSESATVTATPTSSTSGVTGIGINMFDLQGTSLYARYCIQGSGNVRFQVPIQTTSIIRDVVGNIFSSKTSKWGEGSGTGMMPGNCSTSYAYDEIKSGFVPGSTYTLTVNSSIAGFTHSLTKSFTIAGGSTPATKSEAVIPKGLGGYAVVHPNGKVCVVIVATSADPFGNGGTMPVEYMGCPAGSRIIFQTTASPTGNVAGWHGENVTYNGSEFEIKSGTSDSATVQTKIQDGVATDSDGRVWDTGSGAVLKQSTVTTSTTPETTTATTTTTPESATVTTTTTPETTTATTTTTPETTTVTTSATPETANPIAPQTLSIKVSIPDPVVVNEVLDSLGASKKELQLVTKIISNKKSSVSVNTEFANSLLQITARKKGSKTITRAVLTNDNGDAKLNIKRSLSGYALSLKAGAVTLDKDRVGNK